MPEPAFRQLAAQLRCQGMPARSIQRLLMELDDHYDDLYRDARRAGLEPDAATADAAARLGTTDVLCAAARHYPELRAPLRAGFRLACDSAVALVNGHDRLRWVLSFATGLALTATQLLVIHSALGL